METKDQKKHRKKNSGPKAEKKKKRHLQDLQLGDEEDARKRNPKAFAVQSAVRMARSFHRYIQLESSGSSIYPFLIVWASPNIWLHQSVPFLKDVEMHAIFLFLTHEQSFLRKLLCLQHIHIDSLFLPKSKAYECFFIEFVCL